MIREECRDFLLNRFYPLYKRKQILYQFDIRYLLFVGCESLCCVYFERPGPVVSPGTSSTELLLDEEPDEFEEPELLFEGEVGAVLGLSEPVGAEPGALVEPLEELFELLEPFEPGALLLTEEPEVEPPEFAKPPEVPGPPLDVSELPGELLADEPGILLAEPPVLLPSQTPLEPKV